MNIARVVVTSTVTAATVTNRHRNQSDNTPNVPKVVPEEPKPKKNSFFKKLFKKK